MWNCLWGNALKSSPGIIRKRRASYPGPGFLSSATWPLLPKKHYNGLNQSVSKNICRDAAMVYTTMLYYTAKVIIYRKDDTCL